MDNLNKSTILYTIPYNNEAVFKSSLDKIRESLLLEYKYQVYERCSNLAFSILDEAICLTDYMSPLTREFLTSGLNIRDFIYSQPIPETLAGTNFLNKFLYLVEVESTIFPDMKFLYGEDVPNDIVSKLIEKAYIKELQAFEEYQITEIERILSQIKDIINNNPNSDKCSKFRIFTTYDLNLEVKFIHLTRSSYLSCTRKSRLKDKLEQVYKEKGLVVPEEAYKSINKLPIITQDVLESTDVLSLTYDYESLD